MRTNQIATIDDLLLLEKGIIEKIKESQEILLKSNIKEFDEYLRSSQVKEILGGIKDSKLSDLRDSRALTYIDADGTFLYPKKELKSYLERKTVKSKPIV
jgi:hypothetical protein